MSENGRGSRVVSTSDRYAGGLRLNLASYLCSNKHVAKRSAAMLATKGSAAVTHKAAHSGFETQGRCHQKSKAGGISGPTKRTYVLQKNFLKMSEDISYCWLVRGSLFIELGCTRDLGKGWRGDLGTFMISRSI